MKNEEIRNEQFKCKGSHNKYALTLVQRFLAGTPLKDPPLDLLDPVPASFLGGLQRSTFPATLFLVGENAASLHDTQSTTGHRPRFNGCRWTFSNTGCDPSEAHSSFGGKQQRMMGNAVSHYNFSCHDAA